MRERAQTKMGLNRTGTDVSPIDSKSMQEFADKSPVTQPSGGETYIDMRAEYIKEGEHLGSVPLPASLKGAAKASLDRLKGVRIEVLIDKLGERVAFERTGTRLYEQLIEKCRNDPASLEVVSLEVLNQFRDEEAEHFQLVDRAMRAIGADPTAETPCANASGVSASGILKVISDPRSSVAQSLEALLSAEATDNAGWELLTELCEEMGMNEYVHEFERALEQESRHLAQIQEYLRQLTFKDAHVA